MYGMNRQLDWASVLQWKPHGVAMVRGSETYPQIHGNVRFYQTNLGVLVVAEILGLPTGGRQCGSPVFGFHIHEGQACTGNESDPFADALTHYDPHNCPHPYHAGDLPPLFGNDGYAFSACLTNRFSVHDIIGKTVIVHSAPDDFTTQPSGHAGEKIACGEIVPVWKD